MSVRVNRNPAPAAARAGVLVAHQPAYLPWSGYFYRSGFTAIGLAVGCGECGRGRVAAEWEGHREPVRST